MESPVPAVTGNYHMGFGTQSLESATEELDFLLRESIRELLIS